MAARRCPIDPLINAETHLPNFSTQTHTKSPPFTVVPAAVSNLRDQNTSVEDLRSGIQQQRPSIRVLLQLKQHQQHLTNALIFTQSATAAAAPAAKATTAAVANSPGVWLALNSKPLSWHAKPYKPSVALPPACCSCTQPQGLLMPRRRQAPSCTY